MSSACGFDNPSSLEDLGTVKDRMQWHGQPVAFFFSFIMQPPRTSSLARLQLVPRLSFQASKQVQPVQQ